MRQLESIISILIVLGSVTCYSQTKLDFGKLTEFPYYSLNPKDSAICQFDKQLQILITQLFPLTGGFEKLYLIYDGKEWKSFEIISSCNGIDTTEVFPNLPYDSVFSILKKNNVFILESQYYLNMKNYVEDGTHYCLTYKIAGQCRSYFFENPELYKKTNDGVPELDNYISIVKTLFDGFTKKKAVKKH